MLKTLYRQIGQYKKVSALTPVFTALEVLTEILIPFVTAAIIDYGIEANNMKNVYIYGGIMLVLALTGLFAGMMGGIYGAKAVAGEAGVPFFSLAGSDFVEMFVGVGVCQYTKLFLFKY